MHLLPRSLYRHLALCGRRLLALLGSLLKPTHLAQQLLLPRRRRRLLRRRLLRCRLLLRRRRLAQLLHLLPRSLFRHPPGCDRLVCQLAVTERRRDAYAHAVLPELDSLWAFRRPAATPTWGLRPHPRVNSEEKVRVRGSRGR